MCWPIWRRNRHLGSEVVSEYLDGRLSEKDVRSVEAHIEACPNCRREVESLRQTVLAVRRMPMRQPRRSFVFSAPPVMAPDSSRPGPGLRVGSGAAVPVVARPRVPRWAFGAVASACAVAFAVVLSLDLTGFFVAAPRTDDDLKAYSQEWQDSARAVGAVATSTPSPERAASSSQPPEVSLTADSAPLAKAPEETAVPGAADMAGSDAPKLAQAGPPSVGGTWWVWHLAEGLLGGMALVAVMAILLRRRIPILDR